ncbi:MAG: glutathione S-transferase N-terminal domain-containing protein [Gammaproteobacteria bacterium]
MKLHYSATSPYVRKVLVLVLETGLDKRIERVSRAMSPIAPDAELNRDNPLGKVPALVLDEGTVLYDSRVICEYLDTLHGGARWFPAPGPARWNALRRQALGDGILDAAVLTRYETFLRPEAYRWPEWINGQKQKFTRALDALETEADNLQGVLDIGTVAIACALGYLDFRYADEHWRNHRPKLAAWFDAFAKRPALAQTKPG